MNFRNELRLLIIFITIVHDSLDSETLETIPKIKISSIYLVRCSPAVVMLPLQGQGQCLFSFLQTEPLSVSDYIVTSPEELGPNILLGLPC